MTGRHTEHVRFRGEYPDIPTDSIAGIFHGEYRSVLAWAGDEFGRDVARETARG